MSDILTPDICVIGAGAGGLTVAAASAIFGASAVLVERGEMGGDCLNYGCVPSKALLAAAHHAQSIRNAKHFGVSATGVKVDFPRVQARVAEVIAAIAPNDSVERFTGLGVNVIKAHGTFIDKKTLKAGDTLIRARKFVIATGSAPRILPIEGLEASVESEGEAVPFFTNETIFTLQERPKHLLIIGGGPIGMEMAQAFSRLGSKVSVVEAVKCLSREDEEAARIVTAALEEEGITLYEGQGVKKLMKAGDEISATLSPLDGGDGAKEKTLKASHILLAVGRSPNISGLGLDAAGVRHDPSGIKVRANLKTSNSRIFAIGDVTGGEKGGQFTHVANYHAGLVIQQALFAIPAKVNKDIIPHVTFTAPELAQVGLKEEEAFKRYGRDQLTLLRWPYSENDRAQAEGETSGFIKIITHKNGRILGATIVGAHAGEMANIWSLALSQKMKISAMRGFISPYPTRMEISKRAATSFYAGFPQTRLAKFLLKFGRIFG